MRVLIVEDEKRLGEAIAQMLKENSVMTDVVRDGREGYEYAQTGVYDAIILDLMLPSMNGFEISKKLRAEKVKTPILMLTAKYSTTADKVCGLESGADDYMTKPFQYEELLARIRAITRRTGEVQLNEITYGDIVLNLSTGEMICNDKNIHLNYKEFEIMKLLIANQDVAIKKDDIIVKVWGYDSDATDNNVEAYISFIRKKLSFLKSRVSIIALRKIGYKLEEKSYAEKDTN